MLKNSINRVHVFFFYPLLNNRDIYSMESYAAASLSGLGYALTQEHNTFEPIQRQTAQKADLPSMKNIYESSHYI